MKRIHAAMDILILLAIARPVLAHGGADELGHHWELPPYTRELHFQMIMIVLITCAIVFVPALVRLFVRRGLKQ